MSKKKIALIQGGIGAEQDVSRVTGQAFAKALDELGYPYEVIEADHTLPSKLESMRPDVALLALHGKYGEDGTVQGLCEYLKIPYSGSGVFSSALCMDKGYLKTILRDRQIPTPDFQLVDVRKTPISQVQLTIPFPLVVKPSRDGSSVGVTMVERPDQFESAVQLASAYDHYVLVEKMIKGMEVTVPVLKGEALTSIEIAPKSGYYDYENKYTAGRTDYYLPARLAEDVLERCRTLALKTAEICRIRSHARIDFMVEQNKDPYVIEVNTLPGCTPTSLLPKSAKYHGISFPELIETFILTAGLDYEGLR